MSSGWDSGSRMGRGPAGPGGGGGSSLGKRAWDEDHRGGGSGPDSSRAAAADGGGGLIACRMLVGIRKAGSVIGKGGDFIQLTRSMTGAKVGVDKPATPDADERVVHVTGLDEPGKQLCGMQDAALRTAERILGDEGPDGGVKLPARCALRLLLFKFQVGVVMGKRGATINELRATTGAAIKLVSPPPHGGTVAPGAEPDDELLTLAGTSEQVLTALKLVTDRLRTVPLGDHYTADHPPRHHVDKRSRGPDGPMVMGGGGGGGGHYGMDGPGPGAPPAYDGWGDPYGPPPPQQQQQQQQQGPYVDPLLQPPPQQPGPPYGQQHHQQQQQPEQPGPYVQQQQPPAPFQQVQQQPQPPPLLAPPHPHPQGPHSGGGGGGSGRYGGNAIALALPPPVRAALDENDSVRIEGLSGPVTVEYRLLVPERRCGVVLGHRGSIINEVRRRTGAVINLVKQAEARDAGERMLQVMSTEDVQDPRCAAFDAAMDFAEALVADELQGSPVASVRLILPHGQVGAVMGKGGRTIKALRSITRAGLQIGPPPEPLARLLERREELLEVRGDRPAVLLATHTVLVAIRGNMARGQQMFNYPPPPGAPPPTRRGGSPERGGGGDFGLGGDWQGPPPPHHGGGGGGGGSPRGGRARGSRWDSDAPRAGSDPGLPQQQHAPPAHGHHLPGGGQQLPPPQGLVPPPPLQQPQHQPQHLQAPGRQMPPPQQQQPQQQQVVYLDARGQPLPQQPQQPYLQAALPPPQQQQPQQQQQAPHVQYVQAAAPAALQQPQQQQPGYALPQPDQQQQVLMYGGAQPGGGYSAYAPQPDAQQQQPVIQQQQQQQPLQPGMPQLLEYLSNANAAYAQQQQQQQQQGGAPASQPMAVYSPQPVAPASAPQQQHVTYIYASAPQQQTASVPSPLPHQHQPQQQPQLQPPAGVGVPPPPPMNDAPPGPASSQGGFGGLAGLLASAAAAAAANAAAAQQQQQPAAPIMPQQPVAPIPKARVLLTQDQVVRLRLNDPAQLNQLSLLSGAVITLSEHVLDSGAREVLLAGSDAQCNTATNLMEALMRSS